MKKISTFASPASVNHFPKNSCAKQLADKSIRTMLNSNFFIFFVLVLVLVIVFYAKKKRLTPKTEMSAPRIDFHVMGSRKSR